MDQLLTDGEQRKLESGLLISSNFFRGNAQFSQLHGELVGRKEGHCPWPCRSNIVSVVKRAKKAPSKLTIDEPVQRQEVRLVNFT
jgi:hypothetical protein